MYNLKNLFTKNPIQISGAIMAILNLFIIAGIITMKSEAVAGVNSVLVLVLGLFVTNTTVNTARLQNLSDEVENKEN